VEAESEAQEGRS